MKMRIRRVANFLAFNLLFFALYLNFIHQDRQAVINIDRSATPATAAFSRTILVEHPEKYLEPSHVVQTTATDTKMELSKRSIN